MCQTTTIQLVDRVPLAELRLLKAALPDVQLVQVIHVVDDGAVAEAQALAPEPAHPGSGGLPGLLGGRPDTR